MNMYIYSGYGPLGLTFSKRLPLEQCLNESLFGFMAREMDKINVQQNHCFVETHTQLVD